MLLLCYVLLYVVALCVKMRYVILSIKRLLIDCLPRLMSTTALFFSHHIVWLVGGSVAEWLACWTQAQKGPGSNRSRDAVG